MDLLISIRAEARGLVVLGTIDIGAVVEGSIPSSDWPAPSLVLKMPVETGERPVLLAFVLEKQGTLFHSERLEIPEKEMWNIRERVF